MTNYKVSSNIKNIFLNIFDIIGNIFFCIPKILINRKLDNKKVKNILVTRMDNMGDMVLTTSFLKNIKKNYPNSKLTVLCRPIQSYIIKELEFVDEIIEYDSFWFGGKEGIKKLFSILKNNFNKYDLSFELHGEPISIFINFLLSKYSVGFSIRGGGFMLNKKIFFDWNDGKNIVTHQNKQLKIINCKINNDDLLLTIDKNTKIGIDLKSVKKNILVHTGVSVKAREFPILKWIKVINELEKKYRVIIVDTDNEKLKLFKQKNFEVYTPKSINELIKLISKVDLVIGLESLSSHITAAVKTPLIALYSATTPKGLFYPYGKKQIVLRDNKCELNNCGQSECPLGYPSNCLNNISEKEIFESINKMLKD